MTKKINYYINLYKEILKIIKLEVADNELSGIELDLVQMETLAEVIAAHLENKLNKIDSKRIQSLIDFIEDDLQLCFIEETKDE